MMVVEVVIVVVEAKERVVEVREEGEVEGVV